MHPYESNAIIYLAPGYDDPFNQAIAENHPFISNRFREEAGITFIYLPQLLLDKGFQKMMSYNHPYLSNYNHTDLRELTNQIKKQYNITTDKPSFVYISETDESYGLELDSHSEEITREHLDRQIDAILKSIQLIRNENEILEEQNSDPWFRMGDEMFSYIFVEEEGQAYDRNDADVNFDRDAFEVPRDLRERINELKEAGYLSKLIEFIEDLQKTTRKLSRLRITKDYKIYLMDYGMKEVKMSPLPKALYLLFLNHPEGILFKELPDYRVELMNIYKEISLRENPDESRESIIRMTDPFDNSVNEKCSLIRTAFLRVVADDLAKDYYVTGHRGELKNILLDRELVIHEQ